MRLIDYLDKGASLGADAPCLTMDGATLTYGEVQDAQPPRGARPARVRASPPGDKVAILSSNDPIAFACVFGIVARRRGLVPDQPAQRGGREPLSCSTPSTARR